MLTGEYVGLSRKKYSVDLAGQLAECEANYARIMKLLPDMLRTDQRDFSVELAGGEQVQFRMVITERCKYTTMLDINQQSLSPGLQAWSPVPCFSLRIYHDARMAEVVAFDSHQRFCPRYDYPNMNMYQRDEKFQLNRFLGEWLSHCLKFGRELDTPTFTDACFTSPSL